MLNSEFVVNNIDSNYLSNPIKTLKNMGAKIETGKNYIKVLPSKRDIFFLPILNIDHEVQF